MSEYPKCVLRCHGRPDLLEAARLVLQKRGFTTKHPDLVTYPESVPQIFGNTSCIGINTFREDEARGDGRSVGLQSEAFYDEHFPSLPRFDAATQFGAWLTFLDAKPVEKSLGEVGFKALYPEHSWSSARQSTKDQYETVAKAVAEEAARRVAK